MGKPRGGGKVPQAPPPPQATTTAAPATAPAQAEAKGQQAGGPLNVNRPYTIEEFFRARNSEPLY